MNSNPALVSLLRIRISVLLALAAGVALVPCARAADSSWAGNYAGNWTASGNWTNGVPGSNSTTTSTDIATFGFTLTGARIVTVDTGRNIGGITFSNTSAFGYTLSGGSLILSNNGVIQTAAANGAHTDTISTGITLAGNAAFTAGATNASSLLSIGAVTGSATTGNTATLTLNGSNTGNNSITGIIGNGLGGGNLAIVKSDAGTWRLSGANTFTGGLNVQAGTLSLNGTTAAGAGLVTIGSVGNSATLDLLGASRTINSLATGGTAANQKITNSSATAATLNYTGANTTSTFGGVIENGSGTTAVTLNAAGSNLTLSGNNTYSGLTTVTNGTLTLSGNNTGAGGVTLTAGKLNINHSNALGATAGTLAINGGTIDNTSGAALTNAGNNAISIGGSFAFGGTNDLNLGTGAVSGDITRTITLNGTGKTLTLGGTWTNTSNNTSRTLTVNGTGNTLSLGGIALTSTGGVATTLTIAGNANVNVTGAITDGSGTAGSGLSITNTGRVTLSGINTGTTGNITIGAGATLQISSLSNLSAGALRFHNTSVEGSTATLALRSDGSTTFAKDAVSTGTYFDQLTVFNVDRATASGLTGGIITWGNGGTMAFNGDRSQLLVTGANGYGLTLNQNLSWVGQGQNNKANIVNNAPGLLTINGTVTVQANSGGRNTEFSGTGDILVKGQILSTGNSDNYKIVKTGAGTLTLAAAGNPTQFGYIGMAGTLQFGVRSALNNGITGNWTAARIRAASGATLAFNVGGANEFTTSDITTLLTNLAASTAPVTYTTGNASTGVGNGMNAGSSLGFDTTNADGGNFTITNNITNTTGASGGTRGLTKLGTGTLHLSGNNTYTGATTISAGNLSISGVSALGSTSGVNLANNTALIYNGGAGDLTRDISVTGATGSTGTIRNSGTGLLTLSGALSKNGTTLTLAGGSNGITVSGVISGSSNNSDLVIDGGITTLTNANTYNGPTSIINGATLNANAVGALPTSTRSAISIDATGSGSSTLALGANQSVASLTGNTTSTVTLGSNTLTIGTTSGNTTYAGQITGASNSALVKDGASTQVLTGNNTGFAGTTTISGGTLQAAAAGAMGNSTLINVTGGSFLVTAENAVNDNAAINLGGGTLALNGNFNQNVGALTLSADSIIDLNGFSGILRFSGLSWASGASNSTLSIWNWSGPPVNDFYSSHVVFANNANLTAENLAKISFYSGGNNSGFIGNAFTQPFSDPGFSGIEIIAVPEPETYFYAVALLAGLVVQYLRRRSKRKALEGHRPA